MSTSLLSVLLGVCGMFGWGVYDYLGGALSKRMGSFPPLFWSQAVGAVVIGLVAVAVGSSWTVPTPSLLLVPVAAGLYCGGYLFFFAGFEKGNVSIVAATMNVWAVVTMLVAFVFMGQRLTTTQTVGAVTIIAGATLASVDWAQVPNHGFQTSRGVKETVLGAIFFGVYWNVSELISEQIGWLHTTVLIKLGVVAILSAFALTGSRQLRTKGPSPRTAAVVAAMGIVEVGAVAAVNYGLVIGKAILVTPIASALSVVTIALAVLLLREKISAIQALGMAIAIAGITTTAI